MSKAVIVGGARTAIGSFGGSLTDVCATELGRVVIESALERAGIDRSDVEEVIMGNVLQAGAGMNPARLRPEGCGPGCASDRRRRRGLDRRGRDGIDESSALSA